MVIINLRFGHENSIFSLNNFIPVSWGSSNCTNSVVCLFLFSLVVARAHFFPCCWCAVQCADINQHIFESRHWKWNGTKKISWQLQVYDSKWRDDASWFDAAPGSKQRTSAHKNSTKMISQLNSMIVLGVRDFHTKGVMAKTTSNRTSAQHTHTHSLTIPFMMTNVFAQFIRCERVLHIMKRNLWIHLLRLGDSSPNGPKQTILEVMNKKKGWKRKWNKCIKLCNNNDEGHAASLQSEIMCARMRWANNLESNRKRYKTNENKNLKILHWNYLCCLRVWWMGTRAQRFLFIIYCVNSISILCTWAFKELWLALCDRCFFFSPYTKHMEITNNLHIFSQMNTAADHRMLRNEYFWILSGVFLFDSSRL